MKGNPPNVRHGLDRSTPLQDMRTERQSPGLMRVRVWQSGDCTLSGRCERGVTLYPGQRHFRAPDSRRRTAGGAHKSDKPDNPRAPATDQTRTRVNGRASVDAQTRRVVLLP
jgi:hypothetical protein